MNFFFVEKELIMFAFSNFIDWLFAVWKRNNLNVQNSDQ